MTYSDSWDNQLEQELRSQGIEAEVLNFGVGGYGMDQALLRYLSRGVEFHLHIAISGFSIENGLRNLYIFRHFYKQGSTGISLSKPRFILTGDELSLVNHPTPMPEEIPDILRTFSRWKYARYDRFYYEDEHRARFWHHSRFITLLVAVYRRYRVSLLDNPLDSKGYVLA